MYDVLAANIYRLSSTPKSSPSIHGANRIELGSYIFGCFSSHTPFWFHRFSGSLEGGQGEQASADREIESIAERCLHPSR
jgi:hypothetical protein